jgi:uncharacterized glyoxalase superfamily protein PhnB
VPVVSDERPPGGAILKVTDMERTVGWYTAAGFKVRGRVDDEAMNWCEVSHGQTVIQFLAGETPWAGEPCFTGCLYVNVNDIEAVFSALAEPVVSEWGIEDRPWGPREVVLTDPDGYFITFTEPPAPNRA